jgi:DNA-binding MarR family transcriptional regulator
VRLVKLTGREATIVRAIGFADSAIGADIQDMTKMELEDVTDALNGLISAGFVESIPYSEDVQMAEVMAMAFEVNPAYAHELRRAIAKR